VALKVLGGLYKGLTLDLPSSTDTRPTGNLLKRKIFDSVGDFVGIIFCDLFAGSGSMGFEALSHGADRVYLIEDNPRVFMILEKNRQKFKSDQVYLSKQSALIWLKKFRSIYESFSNEEKEQTVIYLDPPYERHDLYSKAIKELLKDEWFRGHLWIESDVKKGLNLDQFKDLEEYRYKQSRSLFTHGDSYILCLKINIKS
jgi:16S rRNA (guanine966-N2)-methyltransferase